MNDVLFEANSLVHVALGTLALLGGGLALMTRKGSRLHVRGGRLFAIMMGLVVITTIVMMFHELLPLAIVLAVAELYLIPSGILSIRRNTKHFVAWNIALMGIVGVLFLFVAIQFVRLNLGSEEIFIGPAILAFMFGFLLFQDWRMLRERPTVPNAWLRRHFTRMIFAFTIAIMALVRIGTNFGISLEATVIVPLFIATLAIAWVYRQYPVKMAAPGREAEAAE